MVVVLLLLLLCYFALAIGLDGLVNILVAGIPSSSSNSTIWSRAHTDARSLVYSTQA
jgi:hypothetical protein